MLEILPFKEVDAAAWNAAAAKFDSGWAWHHTSLVEARNCWAGTTDHSFAIRDSDNENALVALVPIFHVVSRRLPFLAGGILESTGGPALDHRLPPRKIKNILACIRDHLGELALHTGARRIDLSAAPLSETCLMAERPLPNPFVFLGAVDSSTQSWLLHIGRKSQDQLWQGLEHRSRKAIKKASRHNITAGFEPCTPELFQEYVAMHQQTCARNGIPNHPPEYLEAIFNGVADHGFTRSLVTRQDHKVVGIQNFLVYKNKALYWTTACKDEALVFAANDFGFWTAMVAFASEGIDWLECGEAFPGVTDGKMRGLNDFKRSFGGDLYPYFRGQILYRPVLESVIQTFRHIRHHFS